MMNRESKLRYEVVAALVIGIMLPLLETSRRGISYWTVEFTTMFEDYVAGALLLIGGWSAYTGRRWGTLFLVVAWAYFTGLMSSSFWYQVEETLRQTSSESHNPLVIGVKFLLWAIAVSALICSFRTAFRNTKA